MTPLNGLRILSGKVASVLWPVLLILVSTLPGYVVMVYIKPELWLEIRQVLICLMWTSLLAIAISVAASSLFVRTAAAMTVAYVVLSVLCAGTMLFWVLRDAPFGHQTVEWMLMANPVAAALNVIGSPGFAPYRLLPGNWYFIAISCGIAGFVLLGRVYHMLRPR
jgi:ABC-type polysaccharide/polyol phosphate export permease